MGLLLASNNLLSPLLKKLGVWWRAKGYIVPFWLIIFISQVKIKM